MVPRWSTCNSSVVSLNLYVSVNLCVLYCNSDKRCSHQCLMCSRMYFLLHNAFSLYCILVYKSKKNPKKRLVHNVKLCVFQAPTRHCTTITSQTTKFQELPSACKRRRIISSQFREMQDHQVKYLSINFQHFPH